MPSENQAFPDEAKEIVTAFADDEAGMMEDPGSCILSESYQRGSSLHPEMKWRNTRNMWR